MREKARSVSALLCNNQHAPFHLYEHKWSQTKPVAQEKGFSSTQLHQFLSLEYCVTYVWLLWPAVPLLWGILQFPTVLASPHTAKNHISLWRRKHTHRETNNNPVWSTPVLNCSLPSIPSRKPSHWGRSMGLLEAWARLTCWPHMACSPSENCWGSLVHHCTVLWLNILHSNRMKKSANLHTKSLPLAIW